MSVILACNAGSTNTKFTAFDSTTHKQVGHAVIYNNPAEVTEWLCSIGSLGLQAIGHRVVHGGKEFTHPIKITDRVVERLNEYVALAPLHQPMAIKLIEETRRLYPDLQQVACFDTAFHHTMPDIERRLALPGWYHREGIQRYGFHGLSYQHIADKLPEFGGALAKGRVIAAHLGGGSSACAMKDLKSVASTMGFSTLDGLMMGTRSGAIDPGVILHLLGHLGMKVAEVERLLYLESGLQGVSGISSDMHTLLANGKPEAKLAVELYCYQAAKQIAGLLPAIGGLDILVFTGGIGENAAPVRERIAELLRWAGNFPVYVIPANEEAIIADACHAILA